MCVCAYVYVRRSDTFEGQLIHGSRLEVQILKSQLATHFRI